MRFEVSLLSFFKKKCSDSVSNDSTTAFLYTPSKRDVVEPGTSEYKSTGVTALGVLFGLPLVFQRTIIY